MKYYNTALVLFDDEDTHEKVLVKYDFVNQSITSMSIKEEYSFDNLQRDVLIWENARGVWFSEDIIKQAEIILVSDEYLSITDIQELYPEYCI